MNQKKRDIDGDTHSENVIGGSKFIKAFHACIVYIYENKTKPERVYIYIITTRANKQREQWTQ